MSSSHKPHPLERKLRFEIAFILKENIGGKMSVDLITCLYAEVKVNIERILFLDLIINYILLLCGKGPLK